MKTDHGHKPASTRDLNEGNSGDIFVDVEPDGGISDERLDGTTKVEPLELDLLNPQNELSPENKEMLLNSLGRLENSAGVIGTIIRDIGYAPAWAESKVYVAAESMDSVADYMKQEADNVELSRSDTIVFRADYGLKSNASAAMASLPEATQKALKEKGRAHNEKYGDNSAKRLDNVNYLAVCYYRGIGAYNEAPESVRPNVSSAEQWAMGRVNGLLYALENGKFKRTPYDVDLLPENHPDAPKSASVRHLLDSYSRLPLAAKDQDWGFDEDEAARIVGDPPDMQRYERAFLFVNKGETDDPAGYKLPVAKMIGDELQIVFRGVITAGTVLRGDQSKAGFNSGFYNLDGATEKDKRDLYRRVESLYKRFGEEAPPYSDEERAMDAPCEWCECDPCDYGSIRSFVKMAVGDINPTNFPTSGDDETVSLRNSQYPLFDRNFAEMIKTDYPEIWDRGGNILGNKQYNRLVPIAENGGKVETLTQEEAVRLREAWAARHIGDFRVAGVVAQIKWLVIGDRGERYMKELIREEIDKLENRAQPDPTNAQYSQGENPMANDKIDVETTVVQVEATNMKELEEAAIKATLESVKHRDISSEEEVDSETESDTEDAPVEAAAGAVVEKATRKQMPAPQIRTVKDFVVRSVKQTDGGRVYTMEGQQRAVFGLDDLSVRAVYDDGSEATTADERARMGRPPKFYSIEGVASSTSVDHYGTEMTYHALSLMREQFEYGVPVLPRHQSILSDGMAEWDEVIGRTEAAEIRMVNPQDMKNAYDYGENQYILAVKSRLYGDDPKARELVRRLDRGEPIGQSIGGWFNKIDVVESSDGEVMRVLVEDVALDHLAITRAPANPDSYGLASIRSVLSSYKEAGENTAQQIVENMPETMKRHIVKVVEYEDKIDICFGKSGDFMGIFKEGDEIPEMDEMGAHEEEETLGGHLEEEKEKMGGHLDEEKADGYLDNGRSADGGCCDVAVESIEDEEKDNTKRNIDQPVLDNCVILGEDKTECAQRTTTNPDEEYIMKEQDFAKIAELMRSAIAPIADRVDRLENTTDTPKEAVVEERSVKPEPAQSDEMAAMKAELERTRSMLDAVMAEPVRMGRHATTQIRGIGAGNAYSELISRSRQDGAVGLAAVVESNVTVLANENSVDVATRSQHDLIDLLAKGLRAAELDGLLGTKTVTNWN